MSATADYQRGYQAGRKKDAKDIEILRRELKEIKIISDSAKERVYMKSLELVLKHCSGWQIGGKEINDAGGYCKLAKIFSDNSIEILGK